MRVIFSPEARREFEEAERYYVFGERMRGPPIWSKQNGR